MLWVVLGCAATPGTSVVVGRWPDVGPTVTTTQGARLDSGLTGSSYPTTVQGALELGEVRVCAEPTEGPRLEAWDALPHYPVDPATGLAGSGLVVADLTGDGWQDVFLPMIGQDRLAEGGPAGVFVDATWRLPASEERSLGASAADFDGDGDLDLYVAVAAGPNRLLRNDWGTFVVVPGAAAGPDDASTSASWGDTDGDGDLDLVVASAVQSHPWLSDPPSWLSPLTREQSRASIWELVYIDPNQFWRNDGGGTFTAEVLPEPALATIAYQAAVLDLNGDGAQDVYFANDFGMFLQPNTWLAGPSPGWGDEAGPAGLAAPLYSMGLGVADLNDDGLPDLAVASIDHVELLESVGDGTWLATGRARGMDVLGEPSPEQTPWGRKLWATTFADLDADGFEELLVGNGPLANDVIDGVRTPDPGRDRDLLFRRLGGEEGWRFEDVAEAWGVASTESTRAVEAADVDGDGFLDVVKRDWFGDALVWRSRCGPEGWVQVHLMHEGSANPDGVGARVRVTAGGRTWTRWVLAGSDGLSSGGPPVAWFGLGQELEVDGVEVRWPDGAVSVVEEPFEARRRVTVRR